MIKKQAITRECVSRSSRPRVADPDFQALLDHLGRLLAKEYVALLTAARQTANDKRGRGTRS